MIQRSPDGDLHRALRRLGTALLVLVLAGLAAHATAGDHDDHERARAALNAGQVLPLGRLLAIVAADFPGDVLEVELEREDGSWIYEMVVLRPDGAVLEVVLDAATGAVLKVEGDRLESRDDDDRDGGG